MIDFRIDTFISVCTHMNFTKAAAELNITQPAVSQHIRYLEEQYHTKLFLHTGKKIALTESGRMLLDAATTMKHDVQHLKRVIEQKSSRQRELKCGVTLTVGEFMVPMQMAAYLKQHPSMPVSIVVDNTQELLSALNEGKIDFAIVEGYFAKNEYDFEIYKKESFIAVCAANHIFSAYPFEIEDLLSENIIVREKGSGNREILERNLEGKNLSLMDFNNVVEISNINAIKIMIKQDCGIAFLYEAAVEKELEEGVLKKIPLEDFKITNDITFIWRKNSIFSDHYRHLYHALKV